jgi:hypothetical protein
MTVTRRVAGLEEVGGVWAAEAALLDARDEVGGRHEAHLADGVVGGRVGVFGGAARGEGARGEGVGEGAQVVRLVRAGGVGERLRGGGAGAAKPGRRGSVRARRRAGHARGENYRGGR